MVRTSSLVLIHSGSALSGSFTATIVRVGFTRPGTNPAWIPSASERGSPSANASPETTAAAASRRAAASIRFSVPTSSSGPHRPQLRTRAATSAKCAGTATAAHLIPAPSPRLAVVAGRGCGDTEGATGSKIREGPHDGDDASGGVHGAARALE